MSVSLSMSPAPQQPAQKNDIVHWSRIPSSDGVPQWTSSSESTKSFVVTPLPTQVLSKWAYDKSPAFKKPEAPSTQTETGLSHENALDALSAGGGDDNGNANTLFGSSAAA
ncbi:hypothetical protein DAPK24_035610 [Pichia kluyveri]|uniref:Uncharacterized protein n=1 Tax=Pichia kluyveri TaxID=36015 RepID=A0AAV5R6V3_PICKL|nr:hypothetical protein DAPK24_035610 [Pichia kluyveri]